ncbi:MAG: hypothetical protein ACYC8V_09040 [Caulobacteraceae bacterium]
MPRLEAPCSPQLRGLIQPLRWIALAAFLAAPALAGAAPTGTVTKALRPEMRAFDAKGQPLGVVKASSLKLPAPIVAFGVGGSIGVNAAGKTIFLRGLDVQTEGVHAACAPVQSSARASGSAYAATRMGLGGAADCARPAR